MQRAHSDWGFMTEANGTLVGVFLGYDRGYQHERGIEGIKHILGISDKELPQGVGERQATRVPPGLVFGTYDAKPHDKRRRPYPAAYLLVTSDMTLVAELHTDLAATLNRLEAPFTGDTTDKDYKEQFDLVCSWDRSQFLLHARGEQNIARLHELHEAIARCDIAVDLPWTRSRMRTGPSLVIVSRVTTEDAENILAQDQAHKKLMDAARATGIYEELEQAGRRWHALSPDWVDRDAQDAVMFFVNPWEQSQYNHGWFTVEELRAWCRNEGLVVKDPALVAFRNANRDFGYNLSCGMQAQGLHLRVHESLTWVDEAKTVIGARLLVAKNSQDVLPSGVYPVEDLMRRFPVPVTD